MAQSERLFELEREIERRAKRVILFEQAGRFSLKAQRAFSAAKDIGGFKSNWAWLAGIWWRGRMRWTLLQLEDLTGFNQFSIKELKTQADLLANVGWDQEALRYLRRISDLDPSPDDLDPGDEVKTGEPGLY